MGKIGLLALALLVTNLWADTYVCEGYNCSPGNAILTIIRHSGDEYVCKGYNCSPGNANWTISGGKVSADRIVSILYANGMLDISNNQNTSFSNNRSTSTSKNKSNSGTRHREKSWAELGREMNELGLAIKKWAGDDDPAARREQQQISEKEKKAFLKQYDSDGDGFCIGDYEMQLMSNLCDGDDLCPKTPGKYDGCTLKQKIRMDNDADRDGFCDDDEIYQKHSELFEGIDLCPGLSGTSPDGCTEEVRAMMKKDAKETIELQIRQLFDSDNDGFCSEEFVCSDKWGECAKYAADYGIKERLSFKKYKYSNPFLSKAEKKAAIADAKEKVCTKGYIDACPYNWGRSMGCSNQNLREYVKKTYGDYDQDHDGFCDKWIEEMGLWRAEGIGCDQDYLDECPTEFGGERGCPRQQDNSFARQKANRPKGRCCPPGAIGCHDDCTQSERNAGGKNYDNSRQNNGNGLFVNGKKVKIW